MSDLDILKKVYSDDDIYRYLLGDCMPPIADYHHLVVKAGRDTLDDVIAIVHCTGGLWCDMLRYEEDGQPYIGTLDPTQELRLWKTKANQELFWQCGGHAKLGHYTMVIDADTSPPTVESMAEDMNGFLTHGLTPQLDKMWPFVTRHIEGLGWAYCPVSDDWWPLGIFIVSQAKLSWINHLESRLRENHKPYCRVVREDDQCTWHLPSELKAACGISGE